MVLFSLSSWLFLLPYIYLSLFHSFCPYLINSSLSNSIFRLPFRFLNDLFYVSAPVLFINGPPSYLILITALLLIVSIAFFVSCRESLLYAILQILASIRMVNFPCFWQMYADYLISKFGKGFK
ncbi:hypothetical protein AABB24_014034 [Solanum stoloniferum]|uniref:Uncharacterized protein n=1 Tax=Solanum stoloniferum TaxID=62892 RepID=A0ABD2TZL4_9SOLN